MLGYLNKRGKGFYCYTEKKQRTLLSCTRKKRSILPPPAGRRTSYCLDWKLTVSPANIRSHSDMLFFSTDKGLSWNDHSGGFYGDGMRAGQLDGLIVWTTYCLTKNKALSWKKNPAPLLHLTHRYHQLIRPSSAWACSSCSHHSPVS